MAVFTPEEIEPDILNDLKEEIIDLYESSIQTLIELELTPNDNEMQRALFRSVHTIKGDLGLVGFIPMIEVLQYLEDVLDMLRKGEITYSNPLHDFVVRLLDKVSSFVEDCVALGKAEYDKEAIDNASDIIKKITASNTSEHSNLLKRAISVFGGGEAQDDLNASSPIELPKTGIPKNIAPEKQQDLLFFRELMRSIEKRSGLTEGHGDRLAAIALYINSLSETPIEEDQLAVACYVHDFGLAFMPQDVVNKTDELSSLEQNLLRSHVYKSTRLLEHLPAWDGARKIIMQHHEHKDGSGYPLGVSGDEICDGATLLAIVESYINLLDRDPSFDQQVAALITLNKNYKGKFNANWLRLFNNAMSEYFNSH